MRFTEYQYDQAIEAMQLAKQQLDPDGHCCAVCGDSGHMAFECGANPLVAVAMCREMAKGADELHETLHRIAGYDQSFGVQLGPARMHLPYRSHEIADAAINGDWDRVAELEQDQGATP